MRYTLPPAIWRYRTRDDIGAFESLMAEAAQQTKTDTLTVYTEPGESPRSWRVGVSAAEGRTPIGSVTLANGIVEIVLPPLIQPGAYDQALIEWRRWLEARELVPLNNPHRSSLPPVRFTLNTTPYLFAEWIAKKAPIPNITYGGSLLHRALQTWRREGAGPRKLAVEVALSEIGEDGIETFLPPPTVFTAWLREDGEPASGWRAHPPSRPWLSVDAITLEIDDIGGGRIEVTATCHDGLLDGWFASVIARIQETYPEARPVPEGGQPAPVEEPPGKAGPAAPGANRQPEYDRAYALMKRLIGEGAGLKEARRQALAAYCKETDKDPQDKNVRDSFRTAMNLRAKREKGGQV